MPKFRNNFCLVSRPFCWPTTMMGRPSKKPIPQTIAGSSAKRRSPWISIKSVNSRWI